MADPEKESVNKPKRETDGPKSITYGMPLRSEALPLPLPRFFMIYDDNGITKDASGEDGPSTDPDIAILETDELREARAELGLIAEETAIS